MATTRWTTRKPDVTDFEVIEVSVDKVYCEKAKLTSVKFFYQGNLGFVEIETEYSLLYFYAEFKLEPGTGVVPEDALIMCRAAVGILNPNYRDVVYRCEKDAQTLPLEEWKQHVTEEALVHVDPFYKLSEETIHTYNLATEDDDDFNPFATKTMSSF